MPPAEPTSDGPALVGRSEVPVSPWVTLVARDIVAAGSSDRRTFHSIAQADYVCAIAVTESGHIPFVRQYRPALDRESLELPAGLVEGQEDPGTSASRELAEETGWRPVEEMVTLGSFDPDSARLENRLWGYFTAAVQPVRRWKPEPGIEPLLLTPSEVVEAIGDGTLRHALHIAMLGICALRGLVDLPSLPSVLPATSRS